MMKPRTMIKRVRLGRISQERTRVGWPRVRSQKRRREMSNGAVKKAARR